MASLAAGALSITDVHTPSTVNGNTLVVVVVATGNAPRTSVRSSAVRCGACAIGSGAHSTAASCDHATRIEAVNVDKADADDDEDEEDDEAEEEKEAMLEVDAD